MSNGRFAIVRATFYEDLAERLTAGARRALAEEGVGDDTIDVHDVPGAFELPLAARACAQSGRYAAVICLGAVIKGETTHDEHINRQVSASLGQIALETGLPVLFGVLTWLNGAVALVPNSSE